MNELNEEIKLTINTMQRDIDDGAHGELQSHLYGLLEIKRNELQQRLVERSWAEPALGADKAKPLTTEELEVGGWWCADVSKDCANAFRAKGLRVFNSSGWFYSGQFHGCAIDDEGAVARLISEPKNGFGQQIHRIGNDFYWS